MFNASFNVSKGILIRVSGEQMGWQ